MIAHRQLAVEIADFFRRQKRETGPPDKTIIAIDLLLP